MKKILIFSLAYYPAHVGGAEVAIKEITDRLEPSDIEFHMVTLRFNKEAAIEEQIGNVHVHRVGPPAGGDGAYLSKILFPLLAALRARKLNKSKHFDALWAMMTYMLFPLMLARTLGLRTPYALTLQDGDSYEKVFDRWYIRPFTTLLDLGFRKASVVQTISTYLATWAKKRGYRGAIEVIPNGASLPPQKEYSYQELDVLRAQVGKKEGDVLLISVSRLVHQKAIDVVIQALALLPQNIKLLVVGDGEERPMLEQLVKKLQLSERVVFVGKVERDMTAKYRAIADIFVTPSRTEGLGIAFLSAMAAGLPVVATQEGGLADFIFDSKKNPGQEPTAWAVDKDNPAQIAEAVKDILNNPEQTKKVIANASKMVEQKFNWEQIAKQMRQKVFAKTLGE
ncbi:MAG TPA: glycosyltransferase family 4 protein [Candidatus Paceibacterota bacterium]|nr:glycosyltransferase family 4 protein [Candidatus Paceibacterota bacterium]